MPLTSIHSLPDELIQQIAEDTITHVTIPPSGKDGSDSWTLSHTSSRFRAIVLASPCFWTRVEMTLDNSDLHARPQDYIATILKRAGRLKIDLRVTWLIDETSLCTLVPSRTAPSEEAPPALNFIEDSLSSCYAPFSRRLASLTTVFQDTDAYQLIAGRFHTLPRKFLVGLSDSRMEFKTTAWKFWGIGAADIRAIFHNEFLQPWTGATSGKITISAPTSAIYAISVRFPHETGLSITELTLNGIGTRMTSVDIYHKLRWLPNLKRFVAWLDGPSRWTSSHLRTPLECRLLEHITLTICGTSLRDSLGTLLDVLDAPVLTTFVVSRYYSIPPPDTSSVDILGRNIHHPTGTSSFLLSCTNLKCVHVQGSITEPDLQILHALFPNFPILT